MTSDYNTTFLLAQALEQRKKKNLVGATETIAKVLAKDPTNQSALIELSEIFLAQGKSKEAGELVNRLVGLKSGVPEIVIRICRVLVKINRISDAEVLYKKLLESLNDHSAILDEYSSLLIKIGRSKEALQLYRRAVERGNPKIPTLLKLGLLEAQEGGKEAAISHFQQVVSLDPKCGDAWNNLGTIFLQQGQVSKSLEMFQKALDLQPGSLPWQLNCISALSSNGDARNSFEKLLALSKSHPKNSKIWNSLCFISNLVPDLSEEKVKQVHFSGPLDPIISNNTKIESKPCNIAKSCPLVVGYISADYREHSVSNFLRFIAEHDRSKVKPIAYSLAGGEDARTQALRGYFDQWRNISSMTDSEVRIQFARDKVDVLVDLTGHTAGSRLTLLAPRSAALQVTYLGYPNTTGIQSVDLRITDSFCELSTTDSYYSEKLIRLDRCFIAFDTRSSESLPSLSSQSLLPASKRVRYASAANFHKMNENVFSTWLRILRESENTELLLKARQFSDPVIVERVKKFFLEGGIASDRIILLQTYSDRMTHLAMHIEIDFILDTFPYCGTTTTCEALFMGVPVISLAGVPHRARVGVSLLNFAGLPQYVASDQEAYVQLALSCAAKGKVKIPERQALRDVFLNSSICDSKDLAQELEKVYLGNL